MFWITWAGLVAAIVSFVVMFVKTNREMGRRFEELEERERVVREQEASAQESAHECEALSKRLTERATFAEKNAAEAVATAKHIERRLAQVIAERDQARASNLDSKVVDSLRARIAVLERVEKESRADLETVIADRAECNRRRAELEAELRKLRDAAPAAGNFPAARSFRAGICSVCGRACGAGWEMACASCRTPLYP